MGQTDSAEASKSKGNLDVENEELPSGLVCPACTSRHIRRSMRKTFKDRFMSLLGRWPYRCQMCNTRFNGPQDAASIARENAEHAGADGIEYEDDNPKP